MTRNYNATGNPGFNSGGSSTLVRQEFQSIEDGFAGLEAEIDAKGTFITAGEWVNPGYVETYLAANQFILTGVDATGVFVAKRRIRATLAGVYVYSEVLSSVYAAGNTTVTLLTSVLTNLLTLVEYSAITPYERTDSPISTQHLYDIIAARIITDPTITAALAALTAVLVPIVVDASAGPVVKTLPTTAVHASYVKDLQENFNVVSFTTSDGSTLSEPGFTLETKGQGVTWDRVGNIWYRKQ